MGYGTFKCAYCGVKVQRTSAAQKRCSLCQKTYNKTYMMEYYKRPEVKAHRKEYYQMPERKEHIMKYRKAYKQRPEVKERDRARTREYEQRPEVKTHRKEYYDKSSSCLSFFRAFAMAGSAMNKQGVQ